MSLPKLKSHKHVVISQLMNLCDGQTDGWTMLTLESLSDQNHKKLNPSHY